MKKKFLVFIIVISILLSLFVISDFLIYFVKQKYNMNNRAYCYQNNTDKCYTSTFELLLPKILINEVYIKGLEHDLIKLEMASRIDSAYALWRSDALIGYGVYTNAHYEEEYSKLFNRYSYAYDCGIPYFNTKTPLCKFGSECIASDDFLIFDQVSSKKVHSLSEKIKELNLENKKVFIKMDIAEADIVGIPEILKNSKNITGFSLALHIKKPKDIIDRLPLLDEINKDFVLVARNSIYFDSNIGFFRPKTKYYKGIICDKIFYLSYINKNIIDSYKISMQQNTDKYYKKKSVIRLMSAKQIPYNDISYVVTITEKVKEYFKKHQRKKI